MERVMGIEPTLSAWEAEVLPLNYTRAVSRHCSAGRRTLVKSEPACQSHQAHHQHFSYCYLRFTESEDSARPGTATTIRTGRIAQCQVDSG
jgi:hypothetical protein